MNVADAQVFNRVATTRSFSEAAQQLGVTRSAVSKSVSRLEEGLGVVLLNRSPRKASLTEAGRIFYQHSAQIDVDLERAYASVSGCDQRPVGKVSCSLPSSLGAALLPAILQRFRVAWPELTLNLNFDERYVDLVGGSFDVAIRIAQRLQDSNLLSRRLGTTGEVLVASPAYLAKHGTPSHANELKSHRCLALGSPAQSRVVWRFGGPDGPLEIPVECVITSNTNLALILAACMDDGVLNIPELLVGGELAQRRLQRILPEFSDPQAYGIYAVYPNQKPPAKVRAFIEFVEQELPALGTVDRWAPFANHGAVPGD